MRIAWIGPTPSGAGGVAFAAMTWVRELAAMGVDIECFLDDIDQDVAARLTDAGATVHTQPSQWEYNRWYSRTDATKLITGMGNIAARQAAIVRRIASEHASRPFDVLYQFGRLELFSTLPFRRGLPPFVVHPEVHAAGELRWHWRERELAARCERPLKTWAVRGYLAARAAGQRVQVPAVDHWIAPSRAFAEDLVADLGVASEAVDVVANPIDRERFRLGAGTEPGAPAKILFVSRIAVRKGVEQVVELSHRLGDLAGQAEILILGDRSLWSDYRPLLEGLNTEVASYGSHLHPADLARTLGRAAVLVQPSMYEPFALTVGEALASGVHVVVSDEVGAGEAVDPGCCTRFASGDVAAMEAGVRAALREAAAGRADRARCREEAQRLFDPRQTARQIGEILQRAAAAG